MLLPSTSRETKHPYHYLTHSLFCSVNCSCSVFPRAIFCFSCPVPSPLVTALAFSLPAARLPLAFSFTVAFRRLIQPPWTPARSFATPHHHSHSRSQRSLLFPRPPPLICHDTLSEDTQLETNKHLFLPLLLDPTRASISTEAAGPFLVSPRRKAGRGPTIVRQKHAAQRAQRSAT